MFVGRIVRQTGAVGLPLTAVDRMIVDRLTGRFSSSPATLNLLCSFYVVSDRAGPPPDPGNPPHSGQTGAENRGRRYLVSLSCFGPDLPTMVVKLMTSILASVLLVTFWLNSNQPQFKNYLQHSHPNWARVCGEAAAGGNILTIK